MAAVAALEQLGWKLGGAMTEVAMSEGFMTATSVVMVLLGLGGGMYVLARTAKTHAPGGWRGFAPHAIFLTAMGALYLFMFILPMNPRHSH